MLIGLTGLLITENFNVDNNSILSAIGYTVVSAIFITFGFYYPRYLTPGYTIKEERVTDSEGKEHVKKRIVFS